MKKIAFLLSCCIIITACSNEQSTKTGFPDLSGTYIGQELPGDSAEFFAPGIVSTGIATRDIAISPDGNELYFCISLGGFTYATILVCEQVNGKWTPPEIVSFCKNPDVIYFEPAFSWDGRRLYFLSTLADGDEAVGDQDIWYVERSEDGWGEPVNLGEPVNTEHGEFYPSLTREGHLYFTRAELGGRINRIYRSRLVDGTYQEPELLPENVNCGLNRFNAFISPDEDYIIVPAMGMEDSYGGVDYYIIFRNETDQWSEPMNMGPSINSEAMQEWSPHVSRDGKVLFFMSNRVIEPDQTEWDYNKLLEINDKPGNGNSTIFWISAEIIEELRSEARDFSQDTDH
ncbi:hypothetical protein ACFLTA_06140 [Bacteroidota bacterium]